MWPLLPAALSHPAPAPQGWRCSWGWPWAALHGPAVLVSPFRLCWGLPFSCALSVPSSYCRYAEVIFQLYLRVPLQLCRAGSGLQLCRSGSSSCAHAGFSSCAGRAQAAPKIIGEEPYSSAQRGTAPDRSPVDRSRAAAPSQGLLVCTNEGGCRGGGAWDMAVSSWPQHLNNRQPRISFIKRH